MVSRLEILGLRDLTDIGVEGTEEGAYDDENVYPSLKESYGLCDGEEVMEDGSEPVLELATWRRGEDGRRCRTRGVEVMTKVGELLLSGRWCRSGSNTDARVGEAGG